MKTVLKLLSLSLITLASANALAGKDKLDSTYTSVADGCVIYDSAAMHKDAEIDYLTQECPGLGGYQLLISGGDLRYPLVLKYRGKEIDLTRIPSFHDVAASKVEWLFKRTADFKVEYKALIHRMSYDRYDNDKGDVVSGFQALIVTKLAQENSCAVAVVKLQKDMNLKAREIAEKADQMPCLDLETTDY